MNDWSTVAAPPSVESDIANGPPVADDGSAIVAVSGRMSRSCIVSTAAPLALRDTEVVVSDKVIPVLPANVLDFVHSTVSIVVKVDNARAIPALATSRWPENLDEGADRQIDHRRGRARGTRRSGWLRRIFSAIDIEAWPGLEAARWASERTNEICLVDGA